MSKMAVSEIASADVLDQCSATLDGETPQAGSLLANHDLDVEEFLANIVDFTPLPETMTAEEMVEWLNEGLLRSVASGSTRARSAAG